MFGKYGSCEVHMKCQDGAREQYAFVNYSSLRSAKSATNVLNGTSLEGGVISVNLQSEQRTSSSMTVYTVKVENLSKNTTETTLEELFGFFGDTEIASIKINTPANSPFNYAYVNYYSALNAQRAVSELNNAKIGESKVKVKLHRPTNPQSLSSTYSPFNYFLYGRTTFPHTPCSSSVYPPDHGASVAPYEKQTAPPQSHTVKVVIRGHLTGDDLEMFFCQFGEITSKPQIISGNPNYAYVNYRHPSEAMAALSLNRAQIRGVQIGVKLKADREGTGVQTVTKTSHDYRQLDCEPLLVQMITSSAQPEYKLLMQGIESSLSVKIMPMKNGNGFTISGTEENLEEAIRNLELVISKARDKLGELSFTLSCHSVPLFADQEAIQQVAKLEQKYHIEFMVYNSSTQEPVDVSIFSQFVSTQLKSHTDAPATVDCVSKFLTGSTKPSTTVTVGKGDGATLWEWQDDDGSFKAYCPEHCDTFSREFQKDPTCSFSCQITTRLGESSYTIDFKSMMQTNVLTGNRRQIQCQSIGSTSGEWFYTTDKKNLVPYARQQSSEIEKAWAAGNSHLSMTIDGRMYKIDLTSMKQTNILTLNERKIARRTTSSAGRMINFRVRGMKENLEKAVEELRKEIQSRVKKVVISLPSDSEDTFHTALCKLANSYLSSASISENTVYIEGAQGYIDKVVIKVQEEKLSYERKLLAQRSVMVTSSRGAVQPPSHWEPQTEMIELKSVTRGTKEWTDVEQRIHESLPSAQVQTLQRIQNKWLWDKYRFSKDRMSEKNKGVVNEKQLFHGTSSTPPEKIFKSPQGFDFRFCSRGMWGLGTYFAVNAKYSDENYAYGSAGCAKQLILAKVLTGEAYWSRSDPSLKKPPVKKNSETFVDESYDSVQGNTKGSDIFIIYDHEKAYPEYLITYTTTRGFYF